MLDRFRLRPRPPSALRGLLENEAAGGIVLMAAAALALLLANSPWAPAYFDLLAAKVGGWSVLHAVNDGLMTLFFLVVGLEIKREILDGGLATWPRRALPGIAAVGGMLVPALIYIVLNRSEAENLRGWAIPSATDIAFALGVLALLGSRVPVSLKIFLTALAILDDLGAVLIIAVAYTADLSWPMLVAAGAGLAVLVGFNRAGVRRLWPYLLVGVAVWFCVLRSGVHATVAGVMVALTIPLRASPGRPEATGSPLHNLEHALQPWVAFLILPIFGLANAGVSFAGVEVASLSAPLPLGIALGLLVGKQVGVYGAAWAAIRLKLADVPAHASRVQCYGVALLCGIGFTMSLFIGTLAFPASPELVDHVKIGVLMGSLASALAGAVVLRFAAPAGLEDFSREPR